jgi:hypothetical protein
VNSVCIPMEYCIRDKEDLINPGVEMNPISHLPKSIEASKMTAITSTSMSPSLDDAAGLARCVQNMPNSMGAGGIGVRPIRRLSLKKSRAFEDLSGMTTSSSETSLDMFGTKHNGSRIRTSSEPNCSSKPRHRHAELGLGFSDDDDDMYDEENRGKRTRSENTMSEESSKFIETFSMLGIMTARVHAESNGSGYNGMTSTSRESTDRSDTSNGNSYNYNFADTFGDDFYFGEDC